MGWLAGGEGEGEKRADCAKENKRDRETSRDRKREETGLEGERQRGGCVVTSASERAWEGSREGRAEGPTGPEQLVMKTCPGETPRAEPGSNSEPQIPGSAGGRPGHSGAGQKVGSLYPVQSPLWHRDQPEEVSSPVLLLLCQAHPPRPQHRGAPFSPARQRLTACCHCSRGSSGRRPAAAGTAGPPGEPARQGESELGQLQQRWGAGVKAGSWIRGALGENKGEEARVRGKVLGGMSERVRLGWG